MSDSPELHEDLGVDLVENPTLQGKTLDVVVTGSIGATEAVRFIRALRRLGADVRAWLSEGARRLVTPTALEWASGKKIESGYSGHRPHLAAADACVIAPASASFVSKIVHGIADQAAANVVHSHLGLGQPVLYVPNMNASLAQSPPIRASLERFAELAIPIQPRAEENKLKFPDPIELADTVSHYLHKGLNKGRILLTSGSTRGYIDDVRFIANTSSGATGRAIALELYRRGYDPLVILGPSEITPPTSILQRPVETVDELGREVQKAIAEGVTGAIFAAAVLDYSPKERVQGKMPSGEDSFTINLAPTPKIIGRASVQGPKVGFKLLPHVDEQTAMEWAKHYGPKYGLSLLVVNEIAPQHHSQRKTIFVDCTNESFSLYSAHGTNTIARRIVDHLDHCLRFPTC